MTSSTLVHNTCLCDIVRVLLSHPFPPWSPTLDTSRERNEGEATVIPYGANVLSCPVRLCVVCGVWCVRVCVCVCVR